MNTLQNPRSKSDTRRVLIIGGGFAGLNAALELGGVAGVEVTLVDRHNYHLFQPLLYQVAMAGLSPADIATPIRSLLSAYRNTSVLLGEAESIDLPGQKVKFDFGELEFDYLVLACGATHSYFGHNEWEKYAPGLKTISQATEIRKRVLSAFEHAERVTDQDEQKKYLTYVIVGGGPTGVELAGAIGEMSRFTLSRDFRRINPSHTRVILVEAGPRILPMFSEQQSNRAARDLEKLGVQIWTSSVVTNINAEGVELGDERIRAATVLWAAGVEASELGQAGGMHVDNRGRVLVEPDLSLEGHPNVFVAGDQASYTHQTGSPLPGTAPVALQQGRFIGKTIRNEVKGKPRSKFHFRDKGQMATIGRSRAIVEMGRFKLAGFFAWVVWLVVHVFYLTGFKNRVLVVMQWAWSYLSFRRGARLIVDRGWVPADEQDSATETEEEEVPVPSEH
ncbi:NAD(P)/FAD-dependent oxidoreductase [Gimesia sp.]|uniref:NAD(P)/FAD-dependent oxidoreductase n=1 Tax=Gimesia sp. TaxID=2024833 RepID=UPI000C656985|nr:NAD(P)/FAD-dependent oxidoreductase [Gimesia sp.]MAX36962.1 FAD-dependent oxidoreductase [Gimesia sp.]HAH45891.1 FAD-dependent oxidoreductase [Planctomycetaceae bacterium]HBL45657.1 FAD-dependent oxidoreductase [Planctomycetaceae bacterium]|tara:strand:+ start:2585 stop:3931 length:1347 start_codon:yes stop_codon:yes gene_type:complete